MAKPILYFDMDGVLVDFDSGIAKLPPEQRQGNVLYKNIVGIFSRMEPMPGAIEAVHQLADKFDVYVLSTNPWGNPHGAEEKIRWIQKYFGAGEDSPFYRRVILSANKNLAIGDYLIDDRLANGSADFQGELIRFGSDEFPDWPVVVQYLLAQVD